MFSTIIWPPTFYYFLHPYVRICTKNNSYYFIFSNYFNSIIFVCFLRFAQIRPLQFSARKKGSAKNFLICFSFCTKTSNKSRINLSAQNSNQKSQFVILVIHFCKGCLCQLPYRFFIIKFSAYSEMCLKYRVGFA